MLEFIGSLDPELNAYIKKVWELAMADHRPTFEKLLSITPGDQKLRLIALISDDVVTAFKNGASPETVAEHLGSNFKAALEYFSAPEDESYKATVAYADAVALTVRADERYKYVERRAIDTSLLHHALAILILQNFQKGVSPESTAEEFCSYLKHKWDAAEQEQLLNMDIKGSH